MLLDRLLAALNSRQEEDLLLDVRRELQQVHDLRDPRSRDAAEAGAGLME